MAHGKSDSGVILLEGTCVNSRGNPRERVRHRINGDGLRVAKATAVLLIGGWSVKTIMFGKSHLIGATGQHQHYVELSPRAVMIAI
jgi:hypothetical protein